MYVNQNIQQQIATTVDALKYKSIQRYMDLLNCLQLGKPYKYQTILELMCLIDIQEVVDNKYANYYLNLR